MIKLCALCAIPILAVCTQGTIDGEVPNEKDPDGNLRERRAAMGSLMRSQSQIPGRQPMAHDLISSIQRFLPNNDWLDLQKVFHRTERTEALLDMMEDWIKHPLKQGLVEIKPAFDGNGFDNFQLVEVDDRGNIVKLNFDDRGLTDDDIKDLSKLPPKLKILNLGRNELTTFNFKVLPKTLKELHLQCNKFRIVTVRDVSENLECLLLNNNEITNFSLLSRNDSLKNVILWDNPLKSILVADANGTQHTTVGRLHNYKIQRVNGELELAL